jgi:predicted GIY-YIG superfamily endonuclease
MANENVFPFDGAFINAPAVYVILNENYQVIYVGETIDLGRRIQEHRNDQRHAMHGYAPKYVMIEFCSLGDEGRRARERAFILQYNPPCNRSL